MFIFLLTISPGSLCARYLNRQLCQAVGWFPMEKPLSSSLLPFCISQKQPGLGLGRGRVGLIGWFSPWLSFRISSGAYKDCVQVPPSGIDLTGLGRCLHLSFLFCCLVRGDFIQKEDCKGEGTVAEERDC